MTSEPLGAPAPESTNSGWHEEILGLRPRLVSIARRVVRSRSEAEDVVDEAIACLVKETGKGGVSVDAAAGWLHRTVLHLAIDRARRWVRRNRLEWKYRVAHREPPAEPGREVERAEIREIVWQEILELPPRQREVIVLREMEGLSYGEIGALLEIAEATTRVHAHQARNALHRRLRDRLPDWRKS